MEPTIGDQLQLEKAIMDTSHTVFMSRQQAASSRGAASDAVLGNELLSSCFTQYHEAVAAHACGSNKFPTRLEELVWLWVPDRELAALALKYLVDTVFSSLEPNPSFVPCVSTVCLQLGTRALEQLSWLLWRKMNPKLYEGFLLKIKGRDYQTRRRTLDFYKQLSTQAESSTDGVSIPELSATPAQRSRLGHTLLKLALESTPLFEVRNMLHKGRPKNVITPAKALMGDMLEKLEDLSWMFPVYQPTIIPPAPWTAYNNGGYYSIPTMVISHNARLSRDMWPTLGQRLKSLDYLGSVPWVVNRRVLELQRQAYNSSHPSVPSNDAGVDVPSKPWSTTAEYRRLKEHRPDLIKEYLVGKARVMETYFSREVKGRRIDFLRTLGMAKTMSRYPRLYFPHRLDYRGRMYPIPSGLSPQGSDYGKSLLLFEAESPLSPTDIEGWRWYLVHGANNFGVDTVSLDERVAWCRANHHSIVQSAKSPWDYQWWTEADKPWCFLAWCIEYQSITSGSQSYTQIPMARDGKCNGLQHLAAATRDTATARLVGLDPNLSSPTDIYTECMEYVKERLPSDSYWKADGHLTRKHVKRNVMTLGYSVTARGMADQILATMRELEGTTNLSSDKIKAGLQLRDYNWLYIREMLAKPVALMEWYKDICQVLVNAGVAPTWVFPDGFRVTQNMRVKKRHKVTLATDLRTVVINCREPTKTLDASKQGFAIAPNVTHSMDAYHMHQVILECKSLGIPIAAVHDSFGMPAGSVPKISIVKHFVNTYLEINPMALLIDTAKENSIPEEVIPEPPTLGDLDLETVYSATYAFA